MSLRVPCFLSCMVAAVTSASGPRDLSDYNFQSYLVEHGKVYDMYEYGMRKELFEARLKVVLAHNREYLEGKQTWWMDVNALADLTADEFQRLRAKKYGDAWRGAWGGARAAPLHATLGNQTNPDSVDWRSKEKVTRVKNQGGCGSCWAFAATEVLESHYAIATGKLVELAPQAMVNCVKNPQQCGGTGGCHGATEELGFQLAVDTGIPLEADLPYKASEDTCSNYKPAVKATGFVKIPVNDAHALETALATKGPVAVTIAAEPFMLYDGGIFSGCSSSKTGADLDHGVVAVGYSPEYWIIRNSWGPGWGEGGYIRISRANDAKTFIDDSPAHGIACKPVPKTQTVGGECGVLFDTSYPTGVAAAGEEVIV